jgi:exosortase O
MINLPIFQKSEYSSSILLITAWILGNIWTFRWFLGSLTVISPLTLIILFVVAIFFLIRFWRNDFFLARLTTPKLSFYPILLILGSEIAAIFLKWFINIPQLILLCFILGSYGLLGLFIEDNTWRKGLSIAIIMACILPFLTGFNSGLGFPVRVITAHAVAQILADLQLSVASSQDIILMENGIAQVDLPCSGMKSLWTGTVFLLGVTWLENRQLGWRWLLLAIANTLLLIIANVWRVFILVVTIEVLQQKEIAQILHIPLGIISFIIASGLTWTLLQKIPRNLDKPLIIQKANLSPKRLNLNWLLSVVIILGIIGQFQPFQTSETTLGSINLPREITTEVLPLTTIEAKFFNNQDTPFVEKLRFKATKLSGSMLMVGSNNWQAHHPPELCFVGNGFKVDKINSKLINNSIQARWLSLQNGELSATYWFQSSEATTDDFIARIWEHISHHNKTWVLISVLFDNSENPDSEQIRDFTNTIYQAVAQSLTS